MDDLVSAVAALENADCPVAAHMIEVYESIPPALDVYAFVAAAAVDFGGTELLRPLVPG